MLTIYSSHSGIEKDAPTLVVDRFMILGNTNTKEESFLSNPHDAVTISNLEKKIISGIEAGK